MNILFIAANYPSLAMPSNGTFVQQFVWAMARLGNSCTVIKPTSVFDRRYGPYPDVHYQENAGQGVTVEVYRPRYLSFSSRDLGFINTGRWTQYSFNRAVKSTAAALKKTFHVFYGHFLYPSGYAALLAGQMFRCPSVVGVGESSLWTLSAFGERTAHSHYSSDGFFLSNSTPNMEMLVDLLGIQPDRILVEPNGVDLGLMYPRASNEMREKHGIGRADFVIAFVGANVDRKGPSRLVKAVEGVDGAKCILVGRGTEYLQSSCVLRSGSVSHEVVPELLSCADVFVLPTGAEGSCNAVIEAMACGLPIITSNGRYMDDIVDDSVSIRVDPHDVSQIRRAIQALKDEPERLNGEGGCPMLPSARRKSLISISVQGGLQNG